MLAATLTLAVVLLHPGTLLAQDAAKPEAASEDPDLQQVLIEVLIVEIETDKASEIGTDLVYSRGSRGREHGSVVHEAALRTLRFSRDNFVTFATPDTGPSAGSTIRPGSTVLGVPHPLVGMTLEGDVIIGDRATIFARMRALVDKGDAQIVSRPIVVVRNGRTAEIHAGADVPYQALRIDKGRQQLTVAFRKVGVDLKVTPHIGDGDIVKIMLEEVNVASLVRTENIRGVDLPYFSSRKERTVVRVPDRQLLVIGGLRSKETRETVRRIPFLGKIPIIGFFFRSTELSTVETELRIYITPTILRRGQQVPLPAEFTRADDARRKLEEEL